MVYKLNSIVAICLAVASPALAFAPQGPLSSRILSTSSAQTFDKTKLFMADAEDDGEVRSECHNTFIHYPLHLKLILSSSYSGTHQSLP
jgi:hypothetical protein